MLNDLLDEITIIVKLLCDLSFDHFVGSFCNISDSLDDLLFRAIRVAEELLGYDLLEQDWFIIVEGTFFSRLSWIERVGVEIVNWLDWFVFKIVREVIFVKIVKEICWVIIFAKVSSNNVVVVVIVNVGIKWCRLLFF